MSASAAVAGNSAGPLWAHWRLLREDWIARCAARYAARGGLAPEQARAAAEDRYAEAKAAQAVADAPPENWADADMESWSDDRCADDEHE